MNAKKAKAARRAARAMTVGMPEGALMINQKGTIRHADKTTRRVYQLIKKDMK